jgi:cyclic-di-GMP-binding protein
MPSFDIVSEVNIQEVDNAVNQARKEIATRFDFKDSKCTIEWDRKSIKLTAEDKFRMESLKEILLSKMAKRGVSFKNLDQGEMDVAPLGGTRMEIKLIQGIVTEKAKPIVQAIRDSKLKVQAQIQDEKIRVSGKSRDDLQEVISLVRSKDFGLSLNVNNFRD